MERSRNEDDRSYLYQILCVITAVVVLLPLTDRTETFQWKMVMAGLQAVTLWFSKLFFERFLEEQGSDMAAFTGIVLYMTCPYRIYVCYDSTALWTVTAWMLLPLYGWAVTGLVQCRNMMWRDGLLSCVSLAGIGYADTWFFLITIGVTLAAAIYHRTILPCMTAAGGCVLFAPGWYRLGKYLLTDAFGELNVSVQSIMPKGYGWGQFFSTYAFREGHPGMGMGLMICLVLGIWLKFVQGEKREKAVVFFVRISVLLLFCATRYCPWDLVQRAGLPFLRLVGMLRTPAVFFGYACACLCVPAVSVIRSLEQRQNKVISVGLPILIIAFGLGVCLYQGYTLGV